MKILEIHKKKTGNFDHLLRKVPEGIVGQVLDESAIIYEDGVPTLGYFIVPDSLLKDIRRVVKGTKAQKSSRTNGIPTQSTVYGVMPRNHLRNDYCRFTAHSKSETDFFSVMNKYCEVLCEYYEKYFPENYKAALEEVNEVHADWRHNVTPFQTININVNHAIKYHRDSGNFRSALSTVLIVKEDIEGGMLTVPEYDMTLSQRDGAFTVFHGQSLIHGVTAIRRLRPNGYRASIVFYSMNGLKNCYPFQDEINRLASREKDKSTVRYSMENKIKLIKMNKKSLQKINSPWLKLIEEPHNVRDTAISDPPKEGQTHSEIRSESGIIRRKSNRGGLEEK
jgi:hypothetical protein